MTIVRRVAPRGEFMTLRRAMDRLFDDDVFRPFTWTSSALEGPGLPLDVVATPDALIVEASLPGMKPDDVEVTVEDNTLRIIGRTADERAAEDGSYVVQEIRRGSFSRTVALPNGLEPDKAVATFENGVLTLTIPKAEQMKPRQIRIAPVSDGNHDRPAVGAGASKA